MVQLAEISRSDAGRVFGEIDVAILPVGITEQHGSHNPLGTDYLVAAAMRARKAYNPLRIFLM